MCVVVFLTMLRYVCECVGVILWKYGRMTMWKYVCGCVGVWLWKYGRMTMWRYVVDVWVYGCGNMVV